MVRVPTNDLPGEQAFLLDLANALHAVQLPADVVNDHLHAVANRFSLGADFLLSQSYVASELRSSTTTQVALRQIPFDAHWKLNRMNALMALAQNTAAGALTVQAARAELSRILAQGPLYPQAWVVVAYAVYAAAVAARVGGAWKEMTLAALLGVISSVIHVGAVHYRSVALQKSFLAGGLGTLAALTCTLVLPPFDMARVVFSGMVLLVPAMVVVIGMHEVANDALESGTFRLVYGGLRFLMLGFGIASALKLWTFAVERPHTVITPSLPQALVFPILIVGALALVVCLQIRVQDTGWVVGGVLVAYGAEAFSKHLLGESGAPFLSAFLLGLAANLQGRRPHHFGATVMVPGLLQLAPGFLGVETLVHLVQGQAGGDQTTFNVMLVALQLVTGLLLANVLLRKSPLEPVASALKGKT